MAFIKRQWGRQSDGEGLSLAIEEQATSTAVGLIALLFRPQPLVAGVGFWVIPDARGHRIASRAVALLSRWALRQASIRRLEAFVAPENPASIRALESSGLQMAGYFVPIWTEPRTCSSTRCFPVTWGAVASRPTRG